MDVVYKINKDLYDYLVSIGARYVTDYERIKYNLQNTRELNLEYLGTYFPRSFIESYKIFCNMFDFFSERQLKFRNAINILDIGSGTGGQLFGLLQAIEPPPLKFKIVKIFTIDGNKDALDLQKDIFDHFNSKSVSGVKFVLYPCYKEFQSPDDHLGYITEKYSDIDIMLSFKFLSETIKPNESGFYAETLKAAEKVLNPNGVLCLVDTTNPIRDNDFVPLYANREIHRYINDTPDTTLRCILPTCCAKNIKKCRRQCTERCFTSFLVPVNYAPSSEKRASKGKITYKLFIKQSSSDNSENLVYDTDCQGECMVDGRQYCRCMHSHERNGTLLKRDGTPLKGRDFENSAFAFKTAQTVATPIIKEDDIPF